MSGGHFDYKQYQIREISDSVEQVILQNGMKKEKRDYWEDEYHHKYPDEVIAEFKKGLQILKQAEIYAHRIDWLLSGDDGDDTFLERLKEDLNEIKQLK